MPSCQQSMSSVSEGLNGFESLECCTVNPAVPQFMLYTLSYSSNNFFYGILQYTQKSTFSARLHCSRKSCHNMQSNTEVYWRRCSVMNCKKRTSLQCNTVPHLVCFFYICCTHRIYVWEYCLESFEGL